jgi:hypothetical protein
METALKRAIARQVERGIVKNISKSEIARAILTGHAALDAARIRITKLAQLRTIALVGHDCGWNWPEALS